MRFMRGPSFATADFTYSLSTSTSRPRSSARYCAFCTAERSVFSITGAMRLFVKATMLIACPTGLPLIRSSTSLAFCGLTRWNLASARNSGAVVVVFAISIFLEAKRSLCSISLLGLRRVRSLRGVSLERARRRKLAELVADHVLRAVHRHKLLAVVHCDRVTNHVRVDGRAARPGANHLLVIGRVHRIDLHHQVRVDERSLFGRACHFFSPVLLL